MRVAIIINPVSGAGARSEAGRERAALASTLLAREAIDGQVFVSQWAGHAHALAQEALQGGATLVYAWGGDGTVNEVGRALAFGAASLGIIPGGSGNGLARDLGVATDPVTAFVTALQAPERRIDVGELDGRLFFNVAGIGFDAHVAARFNERPPGRRGMASYIAIALREFRTYRPAAYTVTIDEHIIERRALLVALANSSQYGVWACIAPGARLDDGRLDLVAIDPRGLLAALWQARRLFTGTLPRAPGVFMRRVERVTIACDGPIQFHVDGETHLGGSKLIGRVHPQALRIRY